MAENFTEHSVRSRPGPGSPFEQSAERLSMDGYGELADQMREYAEHRARFADELREAVASEGLEATEDGFRELVARRADRARAAYRRRIGRVPPSVDG